MSFNLMRGDDDHRSLAGMRTPDSCRASSPAESLASDFYDDAEHFIPSRGRSRARHENYRNVHENQDRFVGSEGGGTFLNIEIFDQELDTIEPPNLIARRKIHLAIYICIKHWLAMTGLAFADLWTLEPFNFLVVRRSRNSLSRGKHAKCQQIIACVERYCAPLRRVSPARGRISEELMMFIRSTGLQSTFIHEMRQDWTVFLQREMDVRPCDQTCVDACFDLTRASCGIGFVPPPYPTRVLRQTSPVAQIKTEESEAALPYTESEIV